MWAYNISAHTPLTSISHRITSWPLIFAWINWQSPASSLMPSVRSGGPFACSCRTTTSLLFLGPPLSASSRWTPPMRCTWRITHWTVTAPCSGYSGTEPVTWTKCCTPSVMKHTTSGDWTRALLIAVMPMWTLCLGSSYGTVPPPLWSSPYDIFSCCQYFYNSFCKKL